MHIKKSQKVFVDAYLLNKEPQGTKTYIKELYKEFAKKNKHIQIYLGCFRDADLEKEFESYENIHFLYFKQKSRIKRMFFEVPRIIKKHQFQYAHFQYVIPFFRFKNCKYIVTIHDVLFNDYKEHFSFLYRLKRNFLFKNSAKKADYLITVSDYSKERIQANYKLKNKKIYITPNGVNSVFLERYDKQQAINFIQKNYGVQNYILYVSRIEPRKNQQLLLNLFFEIDHKELTLVFIGKRTIENKELNLAFDLLSWKQKKKVVFLEDIERDELIEFYRAARAFVYPSLSEGFGIPPIEAGALKIPVLCSNATAMSEFKFFKPYHISMQSNDTEIKKSLSSLLESTNEERLNAIHQAIKETYTWGKAAQVLSMIINKHED
ncbi:MAG: glycosyltransferase family 1 protein [Polaribacter sp.]|nr:glycosyltransferase family 1 protein [Polaribacter sp.]